MSEHENVFTKENLNTYLKELAKEYRKLNGKSMPADIVLIGGAAILANYGFREMTTDIDAVIGSASSMKEAINRVGDKFNLPSGWLNSDFMRTDSYSPRLIEHSQYYRQFSNVLRQNPTCERWNDVIMLDSWRTCWAGAVNRALEAIGSRERVDHRSHALRGLDEQPTIHEGVTARALEKKGIVSERCETNRQIRKDNALLRRLKEMVAEMIRKIRGSVTNIAENLEANWMYMVEAQYHLTQIRNEKQDILNQLEPILDDYEQYVRIQDQIKKLVAQRDKLIVQRKATPILQIRRRNELAEQIDSLTHQLEGRRKAKENLLKARQYPSEKEMQEVGKRLYAGEEKVTRLEKEESTYSLALQRRQEDYSRCLQNAQNVDSVSQSKARTTLRSENINHLANKLKAQYGVDFKNYILQGAIYDTDRWCAGRETTERNPNERKSVRAFLERESKRTASETKPTRKRLDRDER